MIFHKSELFQNWLIKIDISDDSLNLFIAVLDPRMTEASSLVTASTSEITTERS